jgi:hypothetical protein
MEEMLQMIDDLATKVNSLTQYQNPNISLTNNTITEENS